MTDDTRREAEEKHLDQPLTRRDLYNALEYAKCHAGWGPKGMIEAAQSQLLPEPEEANDD